MHWLEKFRKDFRRPDGGKGISQEELAAMVRAAGTGCSEDIICIIEGGGITHPRIADAIAEVAGATRRQRDSLAHKKHHGTWTPPKKKRRAADAPVSKEKPPAPLERAVVMLDGQGTEFARFKSIGEAALAAGCKPKTVESRCERTLSKKVSEFVYREYTYRYADEWDAMSGTARAADMEGARRRIKRRKEAK